MVNQRKTLTRADAARYLGISPATLQSWASKGKPNIPFHKIGVKCVYLQSDLDEYMDHHRVDGPAGSYISLDLEAI